MGILTASKKFMNRETALLMEIEDQILQVSDEQQGMSRSDFQGRCMVIARQIITTVRADIVGDLTKVREGIEADRLTMENIDKLIHRVS